MPTKVLIASRQHIRLVENGLKVHCTDWLDAFDDYRIGQYVFGVRIFEEFFRFGWLVFKDDENVYVMTSNSVLHLIECDEVDNALPILVFHLENQLPNFGEETGFAVTVTKTDFVVVSSNEDSALDYAVLRLKTSNIVEELPIQVSKKSLEPGDEAYGPSRADYAIRDLPAWYNMVYAYPEDLVDWLKSSRSSSSNNVPTPSCEPSIHFNDAEDLKGLLIPYGGFLFDEAEKMMPGQPIFKCVDQDVVAMCSGQVFVNRGKEKKYLISFGVSMPKIIGDIRRKKPDEAKKWFPNYFD